MSKITKETLQWAHKPFDIVTLGTSVGFIREVSLNDSQDEPRYQVQYSVYWIVEDNPGTLHNAWFDHSELNRRGNLFVSIAECACHPGGTNRRHVQKLLGTL